MSSNDLCEELIIEIFSWLPTKSLLRFRSVSKSLYARINSPSFIQLHTLRSPEVFTIIHEVHKKEAERKRMYTIHSERQLSSYVTPVDYPFVCNTRIIGSCNGVLCLHEEKPGHAVIHLWNPSLRRKLSVYDVPLKFRHDYWLTYGFGFDPIINDYKILLTFISGTYVYTIKTHTWREIASPAPAGLSKSNAPCLFNGVLYWVVYVLNPHGPHLCRHIIRTFDLSSEVFSTIELPEPSLEIYEVSIIEGCLAVMSYDRNWIWVRRESNNGGASWSVATKLYEGDHENYGLQFGIKLHTRTLVYNTGVRLRLVSFTSYSSIVSANSRSKKKNIVCANRCIESLELLNMGTTTCDVINGWQKKKKKLLSMLKYIIKKFKGPN